MGWRDRIQKASFKGVPMFVDNTNREHGRRVPVRRLAGQDESVQQDLGLNETTFEIIAYYWGDSYDQQRDTLEAKLVEEGAGPLVLPFRGELNARVTAGPYTSESKDELGYCTIRFSVVVEARKGGGAAAAKSAGGLKASKSTASALKKSAGGAQAAAAANVAKKANAGGMPSNPVKSTLKAIQKATSALKKVQQSIQSQMAVIDDFSSAITEIDATVNTIMGTPSALATKITAVVLGVTGLADTVERNIDRTTGLVTNLFGGDKADGTKSSSSKGSTPFERATPARETLKAVKTMMALNTGETTSAGTSVGKGTVPPAAISRVDAGSVGSAADATLEAAGGETLSNVFSSTGTATTSSSEASASMQEALTTGAASKAHAGLTISEREALNTRTIYETVQMLTVARAAETLSRAEFDSSSLALAALEQMNDAVDELQAYTSSDTVCEALADLRGALADHLTAVASELPSTITFAPAGVVTSADRRESQGAQAVQVTMGQTSDPLDATIRSGTQRRGGLTRVVSYDPPREVPAILIAHEFYGDCTLADDLIARNRLRNPLFVADPIELIEPG